MEPASGSQAERRYRFGKFEFAEATGRLWRSGLPVRLQSQPARVLAMLLAAEGEMVTREELQQALWPEDSYGDFDTGLNTAIRKLRQALDDSAQNPLFVETLPRMGYRFLAPVTLVAPDPKDGDNRNTPTSQPALTPDTTTTLPLPAGPAPRSALATSNTGNRIASRKWWLGGVMILALLLVAVAATDHRMGWKVPPNPGALRLQLTLPAGQSIPTALRGPMVEIAPDGSEVYYVAAVAGTRHIFRRNLTSAKTEVVPGTEGAAALALSPDGTSLLFHREGEVWLADLQQRSARKVAPPDDSWAAAPYFALASDGSMFLTNSGGSSHEQDGRGADWTAETRVAQGILWSRDGASWQVEMSAIAPPGQRGEEFQFPQQVLPDGSLLFSLAWSPRERAIYLRDRRKGFNRLIAEPGMGGRITRDGTLLYYWLGELRARILDGGNNDTRFWTIAQRVQNAGWAGGQASISGNGSLVYLEAPEPAAVELLWVDTKGTETPIPAPARPYSLLDLSMDGDRLLVGLAESVLTQSIWSLSLSTGEWRRLVDDAPERTAGIWSPGGGHALVNSYAGDLRFPNIVAVPADGLSALWRIHPSERGQFPLSWPAEHLPIAFMRSEVRDTSVDIGLLYRQPGQAALGEPADEPEEPARGTRWTERLLEIPGDQRHPAISPDGRLLAFTQGVGEDSTICVCVLPECRTPVTVPNSKNGEAPLWDETGQTVYFRLAKGVYATRLSARSQESPSFEPSEKLFDGAFIPASFWNREMLYDRSSKRFLLARPRRAAEPIHQIHVVLHWPSILRSHPAAR